LGALGWLRSVSGHNVSISAAMIGATAILVWLSFYFARKSGAGELAFSRLISATLDRYGLHARFRPRTSKNS